jgi:hypothetical protein
MNIDVEFWTLKSADLLAFIEEAKGQEFGGRMPLEYLPGAYLAYLTRRDEVIIADEFRHHVYWSGKSEIIRRGDDLHIIIPTGVDPCPDNVTVLSSGEADEMGAEIVAR